MFLEHQINMRKDHKTLKTGVIMLKKISFASTGIYFYLFYLFENISHFLFYFNQTNPKPLDAIEY